MDGRDVERRTGDARRTRQVREGLAALWRNRPAQRRTSAADCAKAARDPERKFEQLKRRKER
jgi:hypothetical protein